MYALMVLFVLGSCQKEEEEFIDDTNTQETFTAGSNLTQILLSASQNNGSLDNIIDGSDCTSIQFPVTVIANGQQITLQSIADLALVEAVFDQFPNDTDVLEIVFPLTLITEDFTPITVNNQDELNTVITNCSDDILNTYSCVEFVYPISCFIYNESNEQINTITLNNNFEWFQYLNYLQAGIYVAIDYPMSVIVNGETIVVNSNQELSNAIAQADCSNGGPSEADFEALLTSGEWYVTYFFDDFDETSNYANYTFTFGSDGTAAAANTAGTTPGTWDYYVDSGVEKVDLFFGLNAPLDDFDEDWEILEASEQIIRLRNESGDGSIDYLTFEREPYTGGGGGGVNELIAELTSGNWYVNLQEDDGIDETCDYVDYQFTFNLDGTVLASSTTETKNGFWTAGLDSGILELVMNFDLSGTDDPFEDLIDDWQVLNYSNLIIELKDVSGGSGGIDYLTFGRDPYTGCEGGGGGQDLSDVLIDGPWYVGSYIDDGVDETYDFYGYSITFNSNGTVNAQNGVNTINGNWSVTGTTTIDLNLDFGVQMPFDELNDDWDVLNFDATTVNLESVSGGGGGTDTLTLLKL